MPDLQELWNYLQEKFQTDLTTVGFNAWIKTAKPLAFRANELLIEVPSVLHKEYWENNLATKVVEGAYEFAEIELTLFFCYLPKPSSFKLKNQLKNAASPKLKPQPFYVKRI